MKVLQTGISALDDFITKNPALDLAGLDSYAQNIIQCISTALEGSTRSQQFYMSAQRGTRPPPKQTALVQLPSPNPKSDPNTSS